jgi:hypothetical protein
MASSLPVRWPRTISSSALICDMLKCDMSPANFYKVKYGELNGKEQEVTTFTRSQLTCSP